MLVILTRFDMTYIVITTSYFTERFFVTTPGFQNRDGVASIRELARKVCVLVNTFGPVIERQYPSSPELTAALAWARAACEMTVSWDNILAEDPSYEPSPEDPALWPGVYPGRPAVPPLPEA